MTTNFDQVRDHLDVAHTGTFGTTYHVPDHRRLTFGNVSVREVYELNTRWVPSSADQGIIATFEDGSETVVLVGDTRVWVLSSSDPFKAYQRAMSIV